MEPVYGTIIQVARLTWKMQGLKFTVTGLENLPDSGGGVVAINHTSYFDFTFAGLPFYLKDRRRKVRFMAKQEVFDNKITGPVNLCAPNPVRFTDFAKALGSALHRPARLVVPDFVVRRLGGEMAEEMILHSQRVVPQVLTDAGFTFTHPDIDSALEYASA
mgnify:CR=1 FL=1